MAVLIAVFAYQFCVKMYADMMIMTTDDGGDDDDVLTYKKIHILSCRATIRKVLVLKQLNTSIYV